MLDALASQTVLQETETQAKTNWFLPRIKTSKFCCAYDLVCLVAFGQQASWLDIGIEPFIFIIAAAAFGGVSHGIYASLLTIGYHVYEMGQGVMVRVCLSCITPS